MRKEKITAEVQLHSDQGFWHTSQAYFNLTQSYDIRCQCQDVVILMDLHYSQTRSQPLECWQKFKYLINLHYSQTFNLQLNREHSFKYLMNLHYSQTSNKLHHYYVQGNSQDIVYYNSNYHMCQLGTNHNQLYVFLQIRKSFAALMM